MANETYTSHIMWKMLRFQKWFESLTRCWRRADRTWREKSWSGYARTRP